MMIFYLVLLWFVANGHIIPPKHTDNCFRFASSSSFAPCVQCLVGFFLQNDQCISCVEHAISSIED